MEANRLVHCNWTFLARVSIYNVCAARSRAGENFFGSKSKFLKAQVRKGLQSIKWHPWAYTIFWAQKIWAKTKPWSSQAWLGYGLPDSSGPLVWVRELSAEGHARAW